MLVSMHIEHSGNVFRISSVSPLPSTGLAACNRLQPNASKSVIMLISFWQKLQNQSTSVSINGKPLAFVTSTHYLGVLIDEHLNWKSHDDNVLKRVRCKLYICLVPFETTSSRLQLVH